MFYGQAGYNGKARAFSYFNHYRHHHAIRTVFHAFVHLSYLNPYRPIRGTSPCRRGQLFGLAFARELKNILARRPRRARPLFAGNRRRNNHRIRRKCAVFSSTPKRTLRRAQGAETATFSYICDENISNKFYLKISLKTFRNIDSLYAQDIIGVLVEELA